MGRGAKVIFQPLLWQLRSFSVLFVMAQQVWEGRVGAEVSDEQLYATWESFYKDSVSFIGDEPMKKKHRGRTRQKQRWYPKRRCLTTLLSASQNSYRRGRHSREEAYVRTHIRGSTKPYIKIGIHQLAAFISTGRRPAPGETASHWYCDNKICCNPRHLCWEDHAYNTTRFCCKTFGTKSSEQYTVGYKCPHEPTCRGCVPLM